MSEYVDFHYMPLEGKITGEQVLKQTEDAINDLGNKVYNLDIDEERIDEAIENSEQAINTADSALSAVTTDRAVWKNTVAEMKATDIDLGVTAATRGKMVFNDGSGAFYGVRSEKSGDVDSDDTVFLDNGNVAERLKQMNIIAKGNNIIYVANVDDLVDSDAVIGNVYGTAGYHTPNDGGNGIYSIRAKTASDNEDGGSIIFLDNGSVAELVNDDTVNVKQFGAKGDGVTDDTTFIQKAFDYIGSLNGGEVIFPKGQYKITAEVTANCGNLTVTGNDAEILSYIAEDAKTSITVKGSEGSSVPIAADITEGTDSFSVDDASGFSVGDFVRINTDELYFVSDQNYTRGEIVQIKSISTNTLTIYGTFAVSYTKSGYDLVAKKLNLLSNVTVRGLNFAGKYKGTYKQIGLALDYIYNGRIENCSFKDFIYGSAVGSSMCCRIDHNVYQSCDVDIAVACTIADASRNIVVENNFFDNNRHGTSTSGNNGLCVDITFQNNTAVRSQWISLAAFSVHGNAKYVNFLNNTIYEGTGGIDIRSANSTVAGNVILNTSGPAIATYDLGCVNVVIKDNVIRNNKHNNPTINIGSDYTITDNDSVEISGNYICDINPSAIVVRSSAKAKTINVSNNTIANFGYIGINVQSGDQIVCNNNTIRNGVRSTYYAIDITATTGTISDTPDLNHPSVLLCNNEVWKKGYTARVTSDVAVICGNIFMTNSTALTTSVTTLVAANNYPV